MSSYEKGNTDKYTKILLDSISSSPKKSFKFLFKYFRNFIEKDDELKEEHIPEPKDIFKKMFYFAKSYYKSSRRK